MESALDRLRAQQAQREAQARREASRAQADPPRGGAPGGGSPSGVANAALSAAERGAIGERLRECWTGDRAALDFDKQSVKLILTTDPAGVVRDVRLAAGDQGRTGPARAFAERARRAALDPQCAQLPLPAAMKGRVQTFEITFRP